ncbi:conserved hypothetical protein [Culex quinquefasciatus]|uniref:Uncharacterized protein n=1 Tax=Culex quinquefasciatus TaxID=7176 RepID=B0W1C1_CULQU|nr:conserved hypothetical protein [Culex quinquefasciatus]|eukprot:XP_001842505.1 conserved hypothetical protein [Culex quinquefasciatus]
MSAVRKNPLVVDFSVLPERPKLEVVQRFVEKGLGIVSSDLRSIQLHNIRHCVLIEMVDPAAAIKIASENHLKYAFKTHPAIRIPVYVDDNTVDVRVHDLPLDLPNIKITEAMQQYGEVLTIRDEVWRNFFAGVPNGVRVLKMKLSKPVPSIDCHVSSLWKKATRFQELHRSSNKNNPEKPTTTNSTNSSVCPNCFAFSRSNRDNGNDGFTTVEKKGKAKRPLDSEKKQPEEKRTCLDDDQVAPPNDHRDNNGQPTGPPKTPMRRLFKAAAK